jgi:hypothetical protein
MLRNTVTGPASESLDAFVDQNALPAARRAAAALPKSRTARLAARYGHLQSSPCRGVCVRAFLVWGRARGSTHQTVLEKGTAGHSDRPHRGQATGSAVEQAT